MQNQFWCLLSFFVLVEQLHLKLHLTEKHTKKQTKICMNRTKVFRVVMKEPVHPETKRVFGFPHQAVIRT